MGAARKSRMKRVLEEAEPNGIAELCGA